MAKTTAMVAVAAFGFSGCGGSSGGGGGGGAEDTGAYPHAITLAAAGDLPDCNSDTENMLVYLKSDKEFQTCDGSKWSKISIVGAAGANGASGTNGTSGISVSEIWRYHTDTYAASTDISAEAIPYSTYIGTVQLLKFSDGSSFISVRGVIEAEDTNTDNYYPEFSDSFFLAASSSEQSYISKFRTFADSRIRYKVTLSTTPTFKAVVDADANFSNNTDTTYTLTKQ